MVEVTRTCGCDPLGEPVRRRCVSDLPSDGHYVYVLNDEDEDWGEAPFYVGMSSSLRNRVKGHSKRIDFPVITSIDTMRCESRSQAAAIERSMILHLRPRMNKVIPGVIA